MPGRYRCPSIGLSFTVRGGTFGCKYGIADRIIALPSLSPLKSPSYLHEILRGLIVNDNYVFGSLPLGLELFDFLLVFSRIIDEVLHPSIVRKRLGLSRLHNSLPHAEAVLEEQQSIEKG